MTPRTLASRCVLAPHAFRNGHQFPDNVLPDSWAMIGDPVLKELSLEVCQQGFGFKICITCLHTPQPGSRTNFGTRSRTAL